VHGELRSGGFQVKTKFRFQKKTSDVQDRIAAYPDQFQEFRHLERALCNVGDNVYIEPQFVQAAEKRLDALDKFFGFEGESVFRKSGIESSHWTGRR
jgi:hypothetical protein